MAKPPSYDDLKPEWPDRFVYLDGDALKIIKRSDPPGELIDFSSILNKHGSEPETGPVASQAPDGDETPPEAS